MVSPELDNILSRDQVYLDQAMVSFGRVREQIIALRLVGKFGSDEMATSLIEEIRVTIQDALDRFAATDFKTA